MHSVELLAYNARSYLRIVVIMHIGFYGPFKSGFSSLNLNKVRQHILISSAHLFQLSFPTRLSATLRGCRFHNEPSEAKSIALSGPGCAWVMAHSITTWPQMISIQSP